MLFIDVFKFILFLFRRVTREGEVGEVFPALFRKLEKSVLIWEKIPWLWSSMGENLSLKIIIKI